MIYGTIGRGRRSLTCCAVRASLAYRGASTLPAGTLLSEKEYLRRSVETLVERISHISSTYRTNTMIEQSSYLQPVRGARGIGGAEQYPSYPARILDDLVICEARAWYTIHGEIGAHLARLFDTEALRDKVFSRILVEELRDKDWDVIEEPTYTVKPIHYNYILTGRPDLLAIAPGSAIIMEITSVSPYSMKHTYPRICLYGLMHSSETGVEPLLLALSTHDSSITVITDCTGLPLKRYLWRINNLRKVGLGQVRYTSNKNYCRSCRYARVCINRREL